MASDSWPGGASRLRPLAGRRVTCLGWHRCPTSRTRYRRLSRYDQTGLVWLLKGRAVLALTERTAMIETAHGQLTYYRHTTEERTKH